MQSHTLALPLDPIQRDPIPPAELYEAVWDILAANVEHFATGAPYKPSLKYLHTMKKKGGPEGNKLVFRFEDDGTVSALVCKHWFEILSGAAARTLTILAKRSGWRIATPRLRPGDRARPPFAVVDKELVAIPDSETGICACAVCAALQKGEHTVTEAPPIKPAPAKKTAPSAKKKAAPAKKKPKVSSRRG
jgi:hypothetical protein